MLNRIAQIIALVTALLLLGTVAAQAETYRVKRGDTLSEIAADYNTSWPKIFKLNRDKIDNPNLIFPGQKLTISGKAGKPAKSESGGESAAPSGKVRPATGSVTSSYGYRTHPITGVYKLHTGTDFSYGDGNAYAALGGTVDVSHPGWAGNLVTISHGGGVKTTYAHLASVTVSDGQKVKAGQVVGRIGSRGMATGPHLHFEVLLNGDYTNPLGWLN
jgi:murein DD-endopeptidase MepM/ murein hydrolase activator NlpD